MIDSKNEGLGFETPEDNSPNLKQVVNEAYYGKRIAEELHEMNKTLKKIMLGIGALRR